MCQGIGSEAALASERVLSCLLRRRYEVDRRYAGPRKGGWWVRLDQAILEVRRRGTFRQGLGAVFSGP